MAKRRPPGNDTSLDRDKWLVPVVAAKMAEYGQDPYDEDGDWHRKRWRETLPHWIAPIPDEVLQEIEDSEDRSWFVFLADDERRALSTPERIRKTLAAEDRAATLARIVADAGQEIEAARDREKWEAARREVSEILTTLAGDGEVPTVEDLTDWTAPAAVSILPDVDQVWRYLDEPGGDHPFVAVVTGWQQRPVEIPRNERDDPVLPGLILPPKSRQDGGKAAALFALQQRSPDSRGYLPSMAPGDLEGEGPPIGSLPLELWDMASGSAKRVAARGAPLPARIFVETVLDVDPTRWAQSAARGVSLPPERFRDFLQRLYPTTWRTWDRRRLPALLEAFALLEAPETRIAWYNPKTKHGGARRVVVPVEIPRSGHVDDWVRFSVYLPPAVHDGPLIDRPTLRVAGTHTAAAWRLVLALSAEWHRPGESRRPVGGKRHWLQRETWKAYRPVNDAQLVAMAFPPSGELLSRAAYRKRLQRARAALTWLARRGFCEVQAEYKGQRIRPGPKWLGWTETQRQRLTP